MSTPDRFDRKIEKSKENVDRYTHKILDIKKRIVNEKENQRKIKEQKKRNFG